MAINVSLDESNKDKPKLKIDLDNGDLQALTDVMKKWKFKDQASLLRFVFAVLLAPDNNVLYIDVDGAKRKLEPIEELLATEENTDGKPTEQ